MVKKSRQKTKNVAIIGIGRVGLPFALVTADSGYNVYGIGRDEEKIKKLAKGKMPFMETGGPTLLKKTINKNLFVTTDYSVVKDCKYIVLTLGTPIDSNMNPVYDQINTALNKLVPFLRHGQTLILRSTVSPRSTQYVKSFIEEQGFNVGKNFYLAFCPERVAEGKSIEETRSIPQIIGGVDKKSTRSADAFFKPICDKTLLTDDTSAELAKLFSNMYRYINFAVANEFMLLAENYNRDIYQITNLVNKNYQRGGLKLPGLAAGPCLFKDGFFLVSNLPFIDLITTSWKINESTPLYLIEKIKNKTTLKNKKVVILGAAFKAEIDDIRESLSFKVRKEFLRESAKVTLHDPYVTHYKDQLIEKDVYKTVKGADIIFIATNHTEYKKINIKKIKSLVKKDCIVCDVWRFTENTSFSRI